MSEGELSMLDSSGLSSIAGRRVFVAASDRLAFDILQSTYLMEQSALAETRVED